MKVQVRFLNNATGVIVSEPRDIEKTIEQYKAELRRNQKITLIDVAPATGLGSKSRYTIKPRLLLDFYQSLKFMAQATPVTDAVRLCSFRIPNKAFADVLHGMAEFMRPGKTLADAMVHAGVFPDTHVAIVNAGLKANQLVRAFDQLIGIVEAEYTTKNELKDSLRGPLYLLGFAVLAIFIMFFIFMPRMVLLLTKTHMDMPWITQQVVNFSMVVTGWPFMVISIVAVVLLVLLWQSLRRDERFIYWFEGTLLRVALLRHLIRIYETARLALMLSALVDAFDQSRALDIAAPSAALLTYRKAIAEAAQLCLKGKSLHEAIDQVGLFDPSLSQFIFAATRSNKIAQGCQQVGGFLSAEFTRYRKNFMAAIEPIMVTTLSGGFLFLTLVMYLPYLSLLSKLLTQGV